jgi:membrane complex biogenesis BtpA family protein
MNRTPDSTVRDLFGVRRALIGMIHVGALPGTPHAQLDLDALVASAVAEARVWHHAGFHALMIENMHDRPYLNRAVGPEITAAMTAIGREVRREVALPLGVQILAGANREALAVALACGASFVRCEGFVFGHVADEGLMNADAGELLRYRRSIGADAIRVFADIKKKHSAHAITADVDIVTTARAAQFALADGVVVTGFGTGEPTDPRELEEVRAAVAIPVFVGSGLTPETLREHRAADGFIIGSAAKREGVWWNPVEPARVADFASAYAKLPEPS